MSTLRSALDELQADDLRSVDDEVLEHDLAELLRGADLLQAEALRRIDEIDRRGSFGRDGHLSMVSWLSDTFRVAHGVAHADVATARALRSMHATRAALAAGRIGRSQVAALVHARRDHPDAFTRSEPLLVEAAGALGIGDLRRALAHWRRVVDDGQQDRNDEDRFARRNLHASPTYEGMVRVDGDLDPESGHALMTALRAIMDAEGRRGSDGRSPAQRRADALGELCRRWLDRRDRPSVAGERPHVTVTMDLATLEAKRGGSAELEDGIAISGESARRIACDATVSRVITRGASEPLDVGRRTPVVPPAIRRALVIRDRGCAFPGCGRPQGWTDAHHVRHWADGGATALANPTLLCRPHHRLVHARRFAVAFVRDRPRFTRPDGSPLEVGSPVADRAPP